MYPEGVASQVGGIAILFALVVVAISVIGTAVFSLVRWTNKIKRQFIRFALAGSMLWVVGVFMVAFCLAADDAERLVGVVSFPVTFAWLTVGLWLWASRPVAR